MHCKLATSAALVGLLAQVATATTCTPANADPLEKYLSSGGGGGGGGVVFTQDPYAWVSNAVKKRETPDARLANLANALSPRALDSVECTATEMCFSLANTPFCLDVTNGDFHDGVGTTGNALTGDYVLADGRKGNLYKGPYPQVTAGDGEAATTTGAGSAGGASETGSPAAGAGTTGDGAAASTPTATGAGASKPSATGGSATGGSAATPSKNAAAGMAGGVGVGGAMALLGAVLL